MERQVGRAGAFTLVELLVVAGILAVLAALALPNLLEAQTRAKVARVESDFRSLEVAIETFRVDNNCYPPCADGFLWFSQDYIGVLGWPHTVGFCTFKTEERTCYSPVPLRVGGFDFPTVTTPVSYITQIPVDPFTQHLGRLLPYCYRNTDFGTGNLTYPAIGWVLTSVGPDRDLLAPGGRGSGDSLNPLSTAFQWILLGHECFPQYLCASLGDINEHEVTQFMVGEPRNGNERQLSYFQGFMDRLRYDPSNGSFSDGDLWRMRE